MCCWLCTLGMIAEDAMDAFILGARMPISVLGSSREVLPTFTSYCPRLGYRQGADQLRAELVGRIADYCDLAVKDKSSGHECSVLCWLWWARGPGTDRLRRYAYGESLCWNRVMKIVLLKG